MGVFEGEPVAPVTAVVPNTKDHGPVSFVGPVGGPGSGDTIWDRVK